MFRKTDVLFIEPTGALAARIERFRSYLVAALEIKADSSIVPGQPIALQWRLNTWPAAADGTVNVRIFIDGHLIREHADVSASESLNGTGWIDEHLISIADPAIAATIYRFGHRVILVEARDSAGSLYRARAGIDIVRDSFHLGLSQRGSWWSWKEPTQRTELWKQPFDFTADFINRSKFSRMSSVSVDI
jgi:hypothetical protein